ncbi:hypothetical protein N7481_003002 [Penicillium waksmanii]|uniref:uncharacterized protein n=1 Tax=Penicillium waksmanii TaxID=69791 RepID=UPI0025493EF8|nr:uncharacterized protein N7481_003002 [Penicillium waksmanii]KAJ5987792.1 hypothetical protein N7481_003002 [Penicillium waksmanii]
MFVLVSGTWEKGKRSVVVFDIVSCGVFDGVVSVKGLLIATVLVPRSSQLRADDFVLRFAAAANVELTSAALGDRRFSKAPDSPASRSEGFWVQRPWLVFKLIS